MMPIPEISRLFTFVGGTRIKSADVNQEFTQLVNTLNTLIDFINSQTAGLGSSAGAAAIGFNATTGVPESNIQDAIEEVQRQVAEAAAGEIPNDSITETKMATGMKKDVAGGVAGYDNSRLKAQVLDLSTITPVGADLMLFYDVSGAVVGKSPITSISGPLGSSFYPMTAGQKNTINILKLKLQQSLAHADIDAWSDLFTDMSLINAASYGYRTNEGKLMVYKDIYDNGISGFTFGYSGAPAVIGQQIKPFVSHTLTSITVKLIKDSNPTDGVFCKVFSTLAGIPNTLLATSVNTISNTEISAVDYSDCTFYFSGVSLTAGTVYAFVLERTGPTGGTLYSNGSYACRDGSYTNYDTITGCRSIDHEGIWRIGSESTEPLGFILSASEATIVWKAVTASQVLSQMAVVADQDLAGNTISWYISDDGTNWIPITLDTMMATGFDATSVYVKCVLSGGANINALAYGGY